MSIKVLDCTLRDGAHLVNGIFGSENKQLITRSLLDAKIDIIEIGFVLGNEKNDDSTYYSRISDVEDYLSKMSIEINYNVDFSLMIRPDKYDLNKITELSNKIRIIRLAFYYEHIDLVKKYALKLMSLGYKISLNPINTPSYDSSLLVELIRIVNYIRPYSFSIVDTVGMLVVDDLINILTIVRSNLDKNISLGIHLHQNRNNLDHLVNAFMSFKHDRVNLIIDATLMGFGRTPGNLQTESLVQKMISLDYDYNLEPLFYSIEKVIIPFNRSGIKWGYDPLYYLTGCYGIDRNYAEYFLEETNDYSVSYLLVELIKNSKSKQKFSLDVAKELLNHVKKAKNYNI